MRVCARACARVRMSMEGSRQHLSFIPKFKVGKVSVSKECALQGTGSEDHLPDETGTSRGCWRGTELGNFKKRRLQIKDGRAGVRENVVTVRIHLEGRSPLLLHVRNSAGHGWVQEGDFRDIHCYYYC